MHDCKNPIKSSNVITSNLTNQLTKPWHALAMFFAVAFAVSVCSSLIIGPAVIEWLPTIEKSSYAPPGWVFGAVRIFLYSSMAIAAWRVWMQRHRRNVRPALILYHTQLGLNLLWAAIFFGFHQPGIAFAEIIILQLTNIATAHAFGKIDKLSLYLFLPSLLWISFTSVLNFLAWIANF